MASMKTRVYFMSFRAVGQRVFLLTIVAIRRPGVEESNRVRAARSPESDLAGDPVRNAAPDRLPLCRTAPARFGETTAHGPLAPSLPRHPRALRRSPQ